MHEMAPYGVLITDEDFRIQAWNRWLETHSCRSESSLLGENLFEVFPDLVERGLDKRYHQALAGEASVLSTSFHKYLFPFPSTLREMEGENMLQTARIAPLHHEDGLRGTVTLVEDVSQREFQSTLLRRQFRRQQLLSSASESLLLAKNPTGVVREFMPSLATHLNARAFAIYLRRNDEWTLLTHGGSEPAKEWIGDLSIGFLTACTKNTSNSTLPVLLDVRERERAISILGGNGFFCRGLFVADNLLGSLLLVPSPKSRKFAPEDMELIESVSHYIAVALDRERAQQALVEAHQELETKVSERTNRLEETVQQLESFSYSVAHDLRAPIRAIKGYGEILLEDFAEEFSKPARAYLARIRIAAVKMELLTKDLLSFCQVSREIVQPVAIQLETLLTELNFTLPALQQDEVLTIEQPLDSVVGHPSMLRQAILNLLENALKFRSPARPLKIVIRTERPAPKKVRIWIHDNGIGIAKEYHKKIFGIFERLHTDADFEGSGIGLAIVARSVQRMGGTYGVESAPDAGSRFWIELPAAVSPAN